MTHQLNYAARSDRGLLRANNQDSVYAGDRLMVVADGMGGHAAGDMASRLVVAAFIPVDERPPGGDLRRPLRQAVRRGNAAIAEMVEENPDLDGMGTTVTALLFDGGRVCLAHVGDSRAYLYRAGVLQQLTHDDTFVQSLVDEGRITEEEAGHHPQRSLLLRALNGTDLDPLLSLRDLAVGDRYLVCSDGLSSYVTAESIAEALSRDDPAAAADLLIELALVAGGPDNVTVIVADVVSLGAPSEGPPPEEPYDPDATGPVQAIHLTQRMPRVPLPAIDGDRSPALGTGPRGAGGLGDAGGGEDDSDDGTGIAGPGGGGATTRRPPPVPAGHRASTLRPPAPSAPGGAAGAFVLALAVLVAVGITASLLWVRTQYYVGAAEGTVVVFRGVDGSLLGWKLADVQENSCGTPPTAQCSPIQLGDLEPAARDQVAAGIPANNLGDARDILSRLGGQLLPVCGAVPSTAIPGNPATTGTESSGTALTTANGASTPPAPGGTTIPNVVSSVTLTGPLGTQPLSTGSSGPPIGPATSGSPTSLSGATSPVSRPSLSVSSTPTAGPPSLESPSSGTGPAVVPVTTTVIVSVSTTAEGATTGPTVTSVPGERLRGALGAVAPTLPSRSSAPLTRSSLTRTTSTRSTASPTTASRTPVTRATLGPTTLSPSTPSHATPIATAPRTAIAVITEPPPESPVATEATEPAAPTPTVTVTSTVVVSLPAATPSGTPLSPVPGVPGVSCRTGR